MFIRGLPVSGGGSGSAPITGTQGSIAFFGPAGTLAEDNANLFWDDTNNRLGVGTNVPDATVQILQAALSAGAPILLHITGGTLTNQAASTEKRDVIFDLSHTVTFATGALATQRAFTVEPPTYAFAGASVLAQASTFVITGAPIAGTNATITQALAARIDTTGALGALFTGDISLSTFSTEPVNVEIAPPAGTARRRTFRLAGGALTNISGGELVDIAITPSSVQFGSGTTLALQEAITITGPTYSATSAKTITEAVTLSVVAPTKGTNVSWGLQDNRYTPFAVKTTGIGGAHISVTGDGQVGAGLDICYPIGAITNIPSTVDYSAVVWGTDLGGAANVSWVAGATIPSPFRWIRISAPKVGRAGGGGSIAVAATVAIGGAPQTSAPTLTNSYSIFVESGPCGFQAISATSVSTNLIEDTDGTDYLVFNSSSNYIDIGNVPGTGFEGDTPITLSASGPAQVAVKVVTNSTNGFSGFLFNSTTDAAEGMIGFGNSAAAAPFTSRMHLRWGIVAGHDMVFLRGSTTTSVGIMSGSSTAGDLARFVWGDETLTAGFTFEVHQPVYATGSPTAFRVSGAAHTTLSNAEASSVIFNLAQTVQFGQNTLLATQRTIQILAATYGSSAATKTITDAVTVDINAAPTAGTNVTITNAMALRVQAGQTQLLGGLKTNGNLGFYNTAPVAQQTVGAVTNNVTAGGVNGTIADYAIVDYTTDAASIRNDLHQLARSVVQIATALRNFGLAA